MQKELRIPHPDPRNPYISVLLHAGILCRASSSPLFCSCCHPGCVTQARCLSGSGARVSETARAQSMGINHGGWYLGLGCNRNALVALFLPISVFSCALSVHGMLPHCIVVFLQEHSMLQCVTARVLLSRTCLESSYNLARCEVSDPLNGLPINVLHLYTWGVVLISVAPSIIVFCKPSPMQR